MSMAAKMITRKIGATIANSTRAWLRWPRILGCISLRSRRNYESIPTSD
jgi:hypothetical protein